MTITIDFLSLGIGVGVGFAMFGLFIAYAVNRGY